jgi:hypothetical protein
MIPAQLAVDESASIPELQLFPSENLVPGSLRLYLKDTFGFEELTDTFVATYKIADQEVTAFFSERTGPQQARELLKSCFDFLIDNGGADKTAAFSDLGISHPKIVDFDGLIEMIFTNGKYIAGIHQTEDVSGVQELAAILDRRLTQVQKK